jgi:hypothetical protein
MVGLLPKEWMGQRTLRGRLPGVMDAPIQSLHLLNFLGEIRPLAIIPDVAMAINT